MKIWILNHYATDMYLDGTGRHHSFAKYMIRKGYDVKIFCANTVHNSDIVVDTENKISIEKCGEDNVPYVFVKTRPYKGNGKTRILNMLDYYKNIKHVLNEYRKQEGLPDVVLASSVHPLTLVAGIKWSKKNKIKCICEVRDLWPETFLDFGFTKKNPIIKFMYQMEKWIYKKSDALIFTMEGGKDYIVEKGWDSSVSLDKINYINNGVDLELYKENIAENILSDIDLGNNDCFKVIYAGSIRPANGVDNIVKCAQYLKEDDIKILIFGDGPDKINLEKYCIDNDINNVIFKGKVDKKYIPYILSKGDINLLNYKQCAIDRFGTSQNKLFEYLASGSPIIANVHMGYDIIEKYNCGISKAFDSDKEYAKAILSIKNLSKQGFDDLCKNAERVAKNFDYKIWADKLEKIILNLISSNIDNN